ncbi:hypothetical protein CFBP6626_07235 [Agrobacterium tumefaciens]|nr:hypothetical protein CFBP6626_07235 [Agrobacterium tumefaciens]CUX21386.1 hypothetical protein AGR5A_Cc190162 [Agrobacterium genomosp. 5 str. CFBP 6626]
MKAEHPMWMYSKDGAKLFQEGDEIPKGYFDSPSKVEEKTEGPKPKGPRKKKETKAPEVPAQAAAEEANSETSDEDEETDLDGAEE